MNAKTIVIFLFDFMLRMPIVFLVIVVSELSRR